MIPFSVARLPRIEFGRGVFEKLPALVRHYGRRVLIVTGGRSLQCSPHWEGILEQFRRQDISWEHCTVDGEPSPQLADEYAVRYRQAGIDVVVGIGGGSALDLAKAVAGLLQVDNSVMDFLEGVGPELPYSGPATPLIAVPTTAGTGSEATRNAVLSQQGKDGFKKSFRDDKLVAEYAVVDPALLASCPPALIAANGMDALTQLIESYVSLKANAFTDALAISGLRAARDALLPWYEQGEAAGEAMDKMAYAAMISGITLAQVGLGSVHGLASPLGAFYPIPHGVVCGTLVAEATRVNIEAMRQRETDNPGLAKYARLAEILCEKRIRDSEQAWQALVQRLQEWTERLQLERLSVYGVKQEELEHVVAHCRGSSMKTNPIVLTDDEVRELLLRRL